MITIKHISYSSIELKKYGVNILFIGTLVLSAIIVWLILDRVKDKISIHLQILLLVFDYVCLFIFYKYTRNKYLNPIINNFFGQKGEDDICRLLESNLDDSYTYIRNYKLPYTKGDIDGILICKSGIILLEIKNYSSDYEVIDNEFYKITKKDKKLVWYNPIKQLQSQKNNFINYLLINKIDIKIEAIVVFAHGNVVTDGSTLLNVLNRDDLIDYIKSKQNTVVLSRDQIELATKLFM